MDKRPAPRSTTLLPPAQSAPRRAGSHQPTDRPMSPLHSTIPAAQAPPGRLPVFRADRLRRRPRPSLLQLVDPPQLLATTDAPPPELSRSRPAACTTAAPASASTSSLERERKGPAAAGPLAVHATVPGSQGGARQERPRDRPSPGGPDQASGQRVSRPSQGTRSPRWSYLLPADDWDTASTTTPSRRSSRPQAIRRRR